jgi:hypothetical protein
MQQLHFQHCSCSAGKPWPRKYLLVSCKMWHKLMHLAEIQLRHHGHGYIQRHPGTSKRPLPTTSTITTGSLAALQGKPAVFLLLLLHGAQPTSDCCSTR